MALSLVYMMFVLSSSFILAQVFQLKITRLSYSSLHNEKIKAQEHISRYLTREFLI
jgi:hypothetical protein